MIVLAIVAVIIAIFGFGVLATKCMTDDSSDNLLSSLLIVEIVLIVVGIINAILRFFL